MGYFGKRPTDDLAAQSEMDKDNPKDLIIFWLWCPEQVCKGCR